jgi:hypothetical protein
VFGLVKSVLLGGARPSGRYYDNAQTGTTTSITISISNEVHGRSR